MEQGRRVVRESSPEPPESVAVLIERADADLLIVDQLLDVDSPVWMGVAFHAQQAAEKYLKALLVAHWRKPPRTHALGELVVLLHNAGCSLPDLSDECETLEPYGVDVRYPEDQPMPTEEEGRAAATAATKIIAAARALGRRPR
jgi:HEPN domain-containing protein